MPRRPDLVNALTLLRSVGECREDHDPECLGDDEEGDAKSRGEGVDDADKRDPDHPVGHEHGEDPQGIEASGRPSVESTACEAMITPEEDADGLGHRQQGAINEGIDQNLGDDHGGALRRSEEMELESVKQIDLHADQAPEGDGEEKSTSE